MNFLELKCISLYIFGVGESICFHCCLCHIFSGFKMVTSYFILYDNMVQKCYFPSCYLCKWPSEAVTLFVFALECMENPLCAGFSIMLCMGGVLTWLAFPDFILVTHITLWIFCGIQVQSNIIFCDCHKLLTCEYYDSTFLSYFHMSVEKSNFIFTNFVYHDSNTSQYG